MTASNSPINHTQLEVGPNLTVRITNYAVLQRLILHPNQDFRESSMVDNLQIDSGKMIIQWCY